MAVNVCTAASARGALAGAGAAVGDGEDRSRGERPQQPRRLLRRAAADISEVAGAGGVGAGDPPDGDPAAAAAHRAGFGTLVEALRQRLAAEPGVVGVTFLLPFGAHKGSGLSQAVDLLSGVLSGARFLTDITPWTEFPEQPSGTGHFFLLIDPRRLLGAEYDTAIARFRDIVRWKLGFGPRERPIVDRSVLPRFRPEATRVNRARIDRPSRDHIQLTWIGHSTFLIQVAGVNFLTDPVFGRTCSPVPSFALRRRVPLPARLEPWSVALGIGITAAVGLFFGAFPASRAARLDPIEALRRE